MSAPSQPNPSREAEPSDQTADALIAYAQLACQYGTQSPECRAFFAQHQHLAEFQELAAETERLRKQFQAPDPVNHKVELAQTTVRPLPARRPVALRMAGAVTVLAILIAMPMGLLYAVQQAWHFREQATLAENKWSEANASARVVSLELEQTRLKQLAASQRANELESLFVYQTLAAINTEIVDRKSRQPVFLNADRDHEQANSKAFDSALAEVPTFVEFGKKDVILAKKVVSMYGKVGANQDVSEAKVNEIFSCIETLEMHHQDPELQEFSGNVKTNLKRRYPKKTQS